MIPVNSISGTALLVSDDISTSNCYLPNTQTRKCFGTIRFLIYPAMRDSLLLTCQFYKGGGVEAEYSQVSFYNDCSTLLSL